MDVYDKVSKISGDNQNQVGQVQAVWKSTAGDVATVLWFSNGVAAETYRTVEKLSDLKIVEVYNGE